MNSRLETQRLILQQFRASDFDAYAELCGDPEVMRYIVDFKPMDRISATSTRHGREGATPEALGSTSYTVGSSVMLHVCRRNLRNGLEQDGTTRDAAG